MSLFENIIKKFRVEKGKSLGDTARTEIRKTAPRLPEKAPSKTSFPFANSKTAKWNKRDRILGRYEVHDVKEGGMGIVYLCYDHNYKMPVALKTLKEPKNTDISYKDLLDKFHVEAEAWVRLEKHKNIVQAKGVERIEGQPYIFLEFITGHDIYGIDLHEWIKRKGQLDIKECLNFAIQFCSGMEYATRKFQSIGKPFVHRDIKPLNIMVTQDGVIKITDFGLVKMFDHTKEDIFIGAGTPSYMSPEQWQGGEDIDIRSDIYAFGCVLYEMLAGHPPFVCPPENYQYNHCYEKPKPIITLVPAVPESLNNLAMKCIEKDPNNRFKDFTTIKDDLVHIYYDLTGNRIKEETKAELESWERINKGIALCSLGYRQDAVLDFNKALEIDPMAAGRFIPDSLAKVREYSSPENRKNKLIFHILSIFSNYSDQKSIAEMLDVLVSRYGLKLISVEGGSGKIDLSFYRNIENGEKKKQTADYFLQHARIQGHEFYAITTNRDIAFYGAEDQELYDKNVGVFGEGLNDKDKWVNCCEDVEKALSVLKKYIVNDELKIFDETKDSLKDRSFDDYILFLKSLMEQLSIKGSFPNISLMIEAASLLKQLNLNEANKEKAALFAYLQQNLKDNEKEGLLKAIYEFREKIITEYQFYSYIKEVSDRNFTPAFLKNYPNCDSYIQRVICLGKKDVVGLFDESNTVEEVIREKFYTNEDQKTLDRFLKHIEIMKKAYATKLRPSEEEYFKKHGHDISGREVVDFIIRQAQKNGITIVQTDAENRTALPDREVIFLPEEAVKIGEDISHSRGFYSAAQKRSIALIKNCLRQMEQEGETAGVLVTGGFHRRLIADYLKEQRIPYIVFVPETELSADDDQRYQDAVKGKKTPFEEKMDSSEILPQMTVEYPPAHNLTCTNCKRAITRDEIGVLLGTSGTENDNVTVTVKQQEELGTIKESDLVVCKECAPKIMAIRIVINAKNEKRQLTVEELQKCEKSWKAKSLKEYLTSSNIQETLPDNAAGYDSITLNENKHLVLEFTCPKCSGQTKAIADSPFKFDENTPSEQLDAYMWMRSQIPMTCPSCNHAFVLVK